MGFHAHNEDTWVGKLKRSDKGLTIQVSSQVSVKGDFEQMHLFLWSLKLYVKTCVQESIKICSFSSFQLWS